MSTNRVTDKVLLSGNEALAHGAWEVGVKVACAYPGTPSLKLLKLWLSFQKLMSSGLSMRKSLSKWLWVLR